MTRDIVDFILSFLPFFLLVCGCLDGCDFKKETITTEHQAGRTKSRIQLK